MPLTVIVIDDEPTSRAFLCSLVDQLGHQAVPLHNGLEGMQYLESMPVGTIDMVLADQRMPEMTGYELLLWLRAHDHFAALPFVLVSGVVGPEILGPFQSESHSHFMSKPVLRSILSSLLEKYESLAGPALYQQVSRLRPIYSLLRMFVDNFTQFVAIQADAFVAKLRCFM